MPAHLKHPKVRQRRNKISTSAEVPFEPLSKKTEMPSHRKDWLPTVREAWATIWASPLVDELAKEDKILLAVAFESLQRFYEKPTVLGGKVVMGIFAPFGLTPLDRRRLNWIRQKPEAPKPAARPNHASSGEDPRDILDGVH